MATADLLDDVDTTTTTNGESTKQRSVGQRRERTKLPPYVAQEGQPWATTVGSGDDAKVLLTRKPDDYDPEKFALLKHEDFATDGDWYDYAASRHEEKAVELRAKAVESRKAGVTVTKGAAKKVQKALESYQKKLAALTEELGAEAVQQLLGEFQASANGSTAADATSTSETSS